MRSCGATIAAASILAACAAAAGCGRVGYDVGEGGVARPRPLCPWEGVGPTFEEAIALGAPVEAEGVRDQDPFVDGAGNLWLSSARGSGGRLDTYVARALPDGGLAAPEPVPELDSGSDVDDGAVAIFGEDDRFAIRSTEARRDVLLFTSRPSATEPFAVPGTAVSIAGFPASAENFDPFVGSDPVARRLHLYWAPTRPARTQDLYVATRDLAPGAAFAGATELSVSSPDHDDRDPTLDASLTIIVFESERPGGTLWYATRADPDSPWSAPIALPALGPGRDLDPFLSRDACTLWFVSERVPGDPSSRDLFRAAVARP